MTASNDRNRRLGTAYRKPETVTHWVRWDDPGIRFRHTLCGELIRASEHSNTPTCPTCVLILEAHERAEL